MNWIWLNVPLMVVFFVAAAGIPLWLVARRPDFGPEPAHRPAVEPRLTQRQAGSGSRV